MTSCSRESLRENSYIVKTGDLASVMDGLSYVLFIDPGSGFPTGETCDASQVVLVLRVKESDIEVLTSSGRRGWLESDDVKLVSRRNLDV